MKLIKILISTLFALTVSSAQAAEQANTASELKTISIGDAEIFYNYQPTDKGVEILTLIGLVSETNNALRGLKNTDRRRLSKLGQLIYQCKLMLYNPDKGKSPAGVNDPILVSKNYSLFTGVDLPLDANERIGIQAEVLQTVDDASLFTASLGNNNTHQMIWETLGADSAVNLKQFNVNVLQETDLIETAESIDITARFPVYQLDKPVSQWSYNFNLKDFRQVIQHIDDNCTPVRLMELINAKT